MVQVSLWTMLFGLTEPLFVPDYWNPPTLFSLAQRTGFDIESLIFSFATGGIATILYQVIYRVEPEHLLPNKRSNSRHRIHLYILFSPFIIFLLLSTLTSLNHMYCSIIAMLIGAISTLYCRPDLKVKIWVGGGLFFVLYFIFFELLNVLYSGYVSAVWNFKNISGSLIFGVPIEELLFGFTFGMFWSSIYEHLLWYKIKHL